MSDKLPFVTKTFRKSFPFLAKDVAHYFPSHMARATHCSYFMECLGCKSTSNTQPFICFGEQVKLGFPFIVYTSSNWGMQKMQNRLKYVDGIIEVHDARIPISGRNQRFHDALGLRPHLLVLNKVDLADMSEKKTIVRKLEEDGIQKVLFTNCKVNINNTVRTKIIPAMIEMVNNVPRYHRSDAEDYNLLVIGIPNVGKSSLTNALRRTHIQKGKATKVGARAGITTSVLEKIVVCHQPKVYVYDTPGIMPPKINNVEVGLKLALCSTLQDHMVGEDTIADYMLYWLNKHEHFSYVEHFGLSEPTDDVYSLLAHVAQTHNAIQRLKSSSGGYVYRPHFIRAAQIVIHEFREGHLGKFNLDTEILSRNEGHQHNDR